MQPACKPSPFRSSPLCLCSPPCEAHRPTSLSCWLYPRPQTRSAPRARRARRLPPLLPPWRSWTLETLGLAGVTRTTWASGLALRKKASLTHYSVANVREGSAGKALGQAGSPGLAASRRTASSARCL